MFTVRSAYDPDPDRQPMIVDSESLIRDNDFFTEFLFTYYIRSNSYSIIIIHQSIGSGSYLYK